MLHMRKATPTDAEVLLDLYFNHLTANPPEEPQDMDEWRKRLARFEESPLYHILVGEEEGRIVSSVTLIVIENLTHNLRPYAVIENVVTHADFRNKHYATILMEKASIIAEGLNCYKIMLMTGSKRKTTLDFYINCGYNMVDKTGFVKWL